MAVLGLGRQPGQARYDGAIHNLSITEAVLGTAIPILIGTRRIHPKLLDYYGFNAKKQSAPTGKGIFGSKGDYWEYYATLIMALAQGPIGPLLNVWDYSGQLENLSSSQNYAVPGGGGSFVPVTGNTAPIQADLGVTKLVPYSVATNDYGGAPKVLNGTQNVPLNKVASNPGALQYSFDSTTGAYTFGAAEAGSVVTVNYSSTFSLYYFEQTQPAIIPNSNPYQITPDNYQYFYQDLGVTFIDTDTPGQPVSGTPTQSGQYHEGAGIYSFAVVDAGRPVYIKYSYTSSDSTISTSAVLSLTLIAGALSQAPWAYTESANPSHALGYSAIGYLAGENMDLGQTAQTPPYNYEVVGRACYPGQIDALVTDAMALVLSDPLSGVGFLAKYLDTAGTWMNAIAHWLANGFFISDSLEASGGISQKIASWLDAGNTAAFFSAGLLKLVPYSEVSAVGNGATFTPPTEPVGILGWNDILLPSGQKPGASLSDDYITTDLKADVDLYNYVQCNWTDRQSSYNNDLMNQQSDAAIAQTLLRIESAQDWTFVTLRLAAQWALSCRLGRNLYINKKFKFALTYLWDFLEPMDVLVLPTGIDVRITQIQEDENQAIQIEAENFEYAASSATIYPTQPSNPYQPGQSSAPPGSTFPAFFQSTTQQNGQDYNVLNIAAAGDSESWGGCQVWLSLDDETYSQIGTINEGCAIGILTAPLGVGQDPDTTDQLSVDMNLSGVALSGATQKVADSFGTLSALISADQTRMEFISYANAQLQGPNRYLLSYLRRGVYGSAINAFGAGDNFVYMGSSFIFSYKFPSSFYGQTVFIKLPSFNQTKQNVQPLSQCKAWAITITGQGLSVNEAFVPSASSTTGLGSGWGVSAPQLAYDRNFTTGASFTSGQAATPSNDVLTIYSGFGTGFLAQPGTLSVNFKNSASSSNNPNQAFVLFAFSLKGPLGVFQTFYQNPLPMTGGIPQGFSIANGTASVALPAGTDISQVCVAINCENVTGNQLATVDVMEIFIDGIVSAGQVYSPSTLLNGWAANAHVGYYEGGVDQGYNFGLNDAATLPYNNPGFAADGDTTSYANALEQHTHQYCGCVWNFPAQAGTIVNGAELKILSSVPEAAPGTPNNGRSSSIWYSVDAGVTWKLIYNAASRVQTLDVVDLPNGLDMGNLQVMAFMDSHDDMAHNIYEIQVASL